MSFLVRSPIDDRDLCVLPVEVCTPAGVIPRGRIETRGIVDTSSPVTRIRADLVNRLALPIQGVARLEHPALAHPLDCLTVRAEFVLRGRERRIYTMLAELLVSPAPIDPGILLGMDCLRDGVFTAHLPERWWSFRAPPHREA